jgi:HEAT repeat protein
VIVYALGKIGPDAAAAETALTAALSNSDKSLALVSAWALNQIHPASAEIATKTLPVLMAGLDAPLPESRRAAAESLGSLGHLATQALPALEKAQNDPDETVRVAAAAAIKSIRAPEVKQRRRFLRRGIWQ